MPKPIAKEVFRLRTLLYFTLWAAIGLVMLFGLGARSRLGISAQQDRNPISVRLSDGIVRSGYTVKISNMEERPRAVAVTLEGLPGAVMWTEAGSRATAAREVRATIPADELAKLRIFVAAPGGAAQRRDFAFAVRALDREGGRARVAAEFEAPQR